ncbi:MAG: GntR family transcriptional regulator [Myxococcales bacterium]|nr:GntR family transcriptional regulator [Myxococcales bacterium]
MGVSRAPVRDALLRLETEGLIESRRDGRYVITLGSEQIESLYAVRRNLEGLALRLAVASITDGHVAELQDLVAGLRSACMDEGTESFARWDVELHARLWDVAGNAYLTRLLHAVSGPIAMVVHACSAERAHRSDIVSEHEVLLSAVAARDVERAVAAIDTHLRCACTRLLGRIAQVQDTA